MRIHLLHVLSLLFIGINVSFTYHASEALAFSYIDEYRDLAIIEMHRSSIPASIILAQGMLESNNGTSKLATEANNHFGIKCKSYWVGKIYYHEDDDFNAQGQLLESCFRSYNSSLESYVDHSNFLKNTKFYAELFTYEKSDVKSWAFGLKKCGYASDPRYAEKLLNLIDKFNLQQYDSWPNPIQR